MHDGELGVTRAGLYVVTLNNEHPIPVNANDLRLASTCILASRLNCKVGKAKNLCRRARNYCDVFGADNVNFRTIALTQEIAVAERLVLKALAQWRVRGTTGRKNEWLLGITGAEAERVALAALDAAGTPFELPGGGGG